MMNEMMKKFNSGVKREGAVVHFEDDDDDNDNDSNYNDNNDSNTSQRKNDVV
jgi:hypothetical protein